HHRPPPEPPARLAGVDAGKVPSLYLGRVPRGRNRSAVAPSASPSQKTQRSGLPSEKPCMPSSRMPFGDASRCLFACTRHFLPKADRFLTAQHPVTSVDWANAPRIFLLISKGHATRGICEDFLALDVRDLGQGLLNSGCRFSCSITVGRSGDPRAASISLSSTGHWRSPTRGVLPGRPSGSEARSCSSSHRPRALRWRPTLVSVLGRRRRLRPTRRRSVSRDRFWICLPPMP